MRMSIKYQEFFMTSFVGALYLKLLFRRRSNLERNVNINKSVLEICVFLPIQILTENSAEKLKFFPKEIFKLI